MTTWIEAFEWERQLMHEDDMRAQYEADMRAQYEADVQAQYEADMAWREWRDTLAPGAPCSVRWQGVTWEAKMQRPDATGPTVLLIAAAGTLVPMVVSWEDVMPPGHVWEDADG